MGGLGPTYNTGYGSGGGDGALNGRPIPFTDPHYNELVANGKLNLPVGKFDADVAPAVTDDSKFYFSPGSLWVDLVANLSYVCLDATAGAAIWQVLGSGAGDAPTNADYLVGTANGTLTNEIVVGTTPGGELGGTWASPTIDATHSGSSHAATQAAAEATAASALAAHVAAADPHTGYVREADANWIDLTDGGASTLHSHAGGAGAHNLLSATHTGDAVTAAAVAGAMIYANATPAWDTTVQATHFLKYSAGSLQAMNEGSTILDAVSYGTGAVPTLRGVLARGTVVSPTAIKSGDILLRLTSQGLGDAPRPGPKIEFVAAEDWAGATAHGNKITFYTHPIGSNTSTLALTIGSDQVLTLVALPIWPSQAAGLFWASPSGAPGIPTMRAIQLSDLPAGIQGRPGRDGEDGEQGPPGLPGTRHTYRYVNVPNAAPGVVLTTIATAQGIYHHSGPVAEMAYRLYVDAQTAPGASGLPCTWAYGDTDDLDTVASWTTIATYTLSSEKSNFTLTMTNALIPANRLMRVIWGTIVGSPADAQTILCTTPIA